MPFVPGRRCQSALLVLLAAGGTAAAQPSLLIIGEDGLDTPHSYGTAISADGLVIAGFSNQQPGARAFRWRSDTDLTLLEAVTNDPNEQDVPFALSADGSVVVGHQAVVGVPIGVVWHNDTAPVEIGAIGQDPSSGFTFSNAAACDPTGTVIVGLSTTAEGLQAVRWTDADGLTALGGLASMPPFRSEAVGIDADGAIFGHSFNDQGFQVLFEWTPTKGMIAQDTGPFEQLQANDASPSGRSMTGGGRLAGDATLLPMLWTRDEGVLAIPLPPGATSAAGNAIGNNGDIMYGRYEPAPTAPGTSGFLWTSELGSVDLNSYLINELNIDPGDWILYPEDVDATGYILTGVARFHPDGSPFALAEGAFVLDHTPPCIADLTGDYAINFFDVALYISRYNAGDSSADIDQNGMLNFFDVSGYITLYLSCN
ncbi:MAG: GC-type dockerin domain-anchored protein [Phycisphaerales bacterium]